MCKILVELSHPVGRTVSSNRFVNSFIKAVCGKNFDRLFAKHYKH